MIPYIKNVKGQDNHTISLKLFLAALVLLLPGTSFSTADYSKKWTIVIDAGHGGKDPGALGSASREKDITLNIALKTGDYIEKNLKNVSVIYTRKTDIFPDLKDRAGPVYINPCKLGSVEKDSRCRDIYHGACKRRG